MASRRKRNEGTKSKPKSKGRKKARKPARRASKPRRAAKPSPRAGSKPGAAGRRSASGAREDANQVAPDARGTAEADVERQTPPKGGGEVPMRDPGRGSSGDAPPRR